MDLRIFDTQIGVFTNLLTENWSQIGNSCINKLSNKRKYSRVIKLVIVIHFLTMHLLSKQQQTQCQNQPEKQPPTTHVGKVNEWNSKGCCIVVYLCFVWSLNLKNNNKTGLRFWFMEDRTGQDRTMRSEVRLSGTHLEEYLISWHHVRTSLCVCLIVSNYN
jgi:hypothetical protein